MAKQKVMIGVPSLDVWYADFGCHLASLVSQMTKDGIEWGLLNKRSSMLAHRRNEVIHKAAERGCSHVLFLDSDMGFPPHTATKLLSHNAKLIGCDYRRRTPPFDQIAYPAVPMHRSLFPVERMGMGVFLLRVDAVMELPSPWFEEQYIDDRQCYTEDFVFCKRMRDHGHTILVDVELSRQVSHISVNNIPYELPHR